MSKNKKKLDPRVRRTRQLLINALIELIPEKGYNAITVNDITDRATLNRATFYLHYREKDDLLYKGTREILDQLVSQQHLPERNGDRFTYEETWRATVKNFEFVAENKDFYKVMLGDNGVWGFINELQKYHYEATKDRFISIHGELPSTPIDIELVLHHLAASFIGIVQWWLENDMPYTPEEMADKLMQLYRDGVYRSLGYKVTEDGFTY